MSKLFGSFKKNQFKRTAMKQLLLLPTLLTLSVQSIAQPAKKDSLINAHKNDSVRMAKFFDEANYPLIKNSKWSGVIPIEGISEKPDPTMKYKLLVELREWPKDSVSVKEINPGLAESGRLINLHIAAGVPKENLETVIVVHGGALNVFLSNEAYRKKFKTDNPNLDLLKQFNALGIKLIACGQAMYFFNFPKEDMISEVKTALSAKVVLSTYQAKGFVLFPIHIDN
jgi:intracellular sulfur oxidation DsrE/DsrF family protein